METEMRIPVLCGTLFTLAACTPSLEIAFTVDAGEEFIHYEQVSLQSEDWSIQDLEAPEGLTIVRAPVFEESDPLYEDMSEEQWVQFEGTLPAGVHEASFRMAHHGCHPSEHEDWLITIKAD
jgi:hypothetical protein